MKESSSLAMGWRKWSINLALIKLSELQSETMGLPGGIPGRGQVSRFL
jgi:hypothetical protein